MTYPLSSAVTAGQPTAAEHYNQLRRDAIYLGHTPEDAVGLAGLLENHQYNLNLEPLGSSRVRCAASYGAPVTLMIDGRPCRVTANVDLSAAGAPSGAAAMWYVFAVSSGAQFTLAVNTSAVPSAGQRLIGSFYWDGSAIAPGSITTINQSLLQTALASAPAALCGGRLSLQSGAPYEQTDRSGSIVYFTPCVSSTLGLYVPGFGWRSFAFSEVSLSLPAAASRAYDIFARWNGSALELSSEQWASLSARSVSLIAREGRWLHPADESKLYLGSVRTNTSGVAADTLKERLLWNFFNQRPKRLFHSDTTSHTYAAAVWRSWNNDSTACVSAFAGLESPISLLLHVFAKPTSASYPTFFGIGEGTDDPEYYTEVSYYESQFIRHVSLAFTAFGPGSRDFFICEQSHASNAVTFTSASLSGMFHC